MNLANYISLSYLVLVAILGANQTHAKDSGNYGYGSGGYKATYTAPTTSYSSKQSTGGYGGASSYKMETPTYGGSKYTSSKAPATGGYSGYTGSGGYDQKQTVTFGATKPYKPDASPKTSKPADYDFKGKDYKYTAPVVTTKPTEKYKPETGNGYPSWNPSKTDVKTDIKPDTKPASTKKPDYDFKNDGYKYEAPSVTFGTTKKYNPNAEMDNGKKFDSQNAKSSGKDYFPGNTASPTKGKDKHGDYEAFQDNSGKIPKGFIARKYENGVVRATGTDSKGRDVAITTNPDGSTAKTVQHKGGGGKTTFFTDKNGRPTREQIVHTRPDGTKAVTQISKDAQGVVTTRHANGGLSIKNGDGSFVHTKPNGFKIEGDKFGNKRYFENGRLAYQDQYYKNSYGFNRQRTVYIDNRTYINHYHGYNYGGYYYNAYRPLFWYPTPYYAYLYNPWTPFAYTWNPYAYSWYYTPYPVYAGPSYWLADHIILSYLVADAVEQRRTQQMSEAVAVANATSRLDLKPGETGHCEKVSKGWLMGTTEVCTKTAAAAPVQPESPAKTGKPVDDATKTQIRMQVEEAIKSHESKTSLTLQTALKNNKYIFNVDEELTVAQEDGGKCNLTMGDMISPIEERQGMSLLRVVASKGEGCDIGDKVLVKNDDLQDMQNAFMEKLEKGMQEMQKDSKLNAPQDKPSIVAEEKKE
ncbi:MAG: hypothetical protein J0M15_05515 [Deltaproteobacteria bacterium]|nr:hypothetical protein [Deltaproteobacteria bacterium]